MKNSLHLLYLIHIRKSGIHFRRIVYLKTNSHYPLVNNNQVNCSLKVRSNLKFCSSNSLYLKSSNKRNLNSKNSNYKGNKCNSKISNNNKTKCPNKLANKVSNKENSGIKKISLVN